MKIIQRGNSLSSLQRCELIVFHEPTAKHKPTVHVAASQIRGWMVATQEGVSISGPADLTDAAPPLKIRPILGEEAKAKMAKFTSRKVPSNCR